MIPELGHFAVILALNIAVLLGFLPLIGKRLPNSGWVALVKPLTHSHLISITLGFFCLSYSFIQHDFSVAYVARNSNSHLPLLYCISGVWGAHEGSILLWVLCLAVWMSLVSGFSRQLDPLMSARILSIMAMISTGFLAFLLLTSNPFLRLFPYPTEGHDLNPLLQDPGLAIHPPLLYMGYVGFSVGFAFAVSVLIEGKLDSTAVRWLRPWILCAWMFLTLGITLGSFWAYYELGWGGWWFWDPVENSSFMPWLVGTALIHSVIVTEKRKIFHSWTVLLAICSFSLSLLGTFLVRSGVLTSVHAFASDPSRGLFILFFLAIVVGGSLLLFANRAPLLATDSQLAVLSRESLLLSNNILLVITAASILLGTLYPLAFDALGLGKLSVGAPYFNTVFFPLMAPLLLLLGIGVIVRWHTDQLTRIKNKTLLLVFFTALVSIVMIRLQADFSFPAFTGCFLAVWVFVSSLNTFITTPFSIRLLGMNLAHIGLAVFTVGIVMSSAYSLDKTVKLTPGETVNLAAYTLHFKEFSTVEVENYIAHQAHIELSNGSEFITVLYPQKRFYKQHKMPMTEAAIYSGVLKDIFIAMGEAIDDSGTWSFRIYLKSFIRWIWMGGLLMALGAFIAATESVYRLRSYSSCNVQI